MSMYLLFQARTGLIPVSLSCQHFLMDDDRDWLSGRGMREVSVEGRGSLLQDGTVVYI